MENGKADLHKWKGWYPVYRADIELIQQHFRADTRYQGVRVVFEALCDMANSRDSATFEAPINLVAHVAGVSYKTAQARLRDLEGCGLVKIENRRGGLDAPRLYSLLGNAGTAHGKDCRALGNAEISGLPTSMKTENTPPPPLAAPLGGDLLLFVSRFRNIRAEFTDARLQDFQISEALRCCPPGPDRERGFSDFERDAATALKCPDNPVKMLRGYMAQAAEGPKKQRKAGKYENRGQYPEAERPLPSL